MSRDHNNPVRYMCRTRGESTCRSDVKNKHGQTDGHYCLLPTPPPHTYTPTHPASAVVGTY